MLQLDHQFDEHLEMLRNWRQNFDTKEQVKLQMATLEEYLTISKVIFMHTFFYFIAILFHWLMLLTLRTSEAGISCLRKLP